MSRSDNNKNSIFDFAKTLLGQKPGASVASTKDTMSMSLRIPLRRSSLRHSEGRIFPECP